MEVVTLEDAFNVRWSNHHRAVVDLLEKIYSDESYVDCSLAADGQEISAHKLVLSACSPFLNNVLKKHRGRHPVIVLRDVSFEDLSAVVEYIYRGEVSLTQDRLTSFLKAAEMLSVAGLTGVYAERKRSRSESSGDVTPLKRAHTEEIEVKEEELDVREEYLSEEGETKDDMEKENEDYQLFLVDDSGSLKELGHVYSEGHLGELKSDVDDILSKIVVPDESSAKELPQQLARGRSVKTNQYNIHCDKCGGLYKHESSYLNHLKHDCSQIHTCNTCFKTFKNKRHLLDHVRDDCGRIHVCPNCDRPFKQKVNLTTHQKHYCKPTR